jgi:hypothetical protein
MANYQVWSNGVAQGPFAPQQLLHSGLNADTLVWTEGLPQWTPARLVPELAMMLQVPSSSPATMYAPQYATPTAYTARPPGNGSAMRWISGGAMALALICFLLPVFSISCTATGEKLLSFSGTQLAFGGESQVKEPGGMLGSGGSSTGTPAVSTTTSKKIVGGDIRALLALILTAIGAALMFVPGRAGTVAVLSCAVGAALFMFILKAKIDTEVGNELSAMTTSMGAPGNAVTTSGSNPFGSGPILRLEYGPGFYLPVLLYVVVIVLGVIALMRKSAVSAGPGWQPGTAGA